MAQFVKRRVINPAPAVLMTVNPNRRKKTMARKRKARKSGTRRRTVRASARRASNPVPKRRRTRRRTHTVHAHARRRHANPVHRRRRSGRRRHRNPFGGASSEIINFTVAGIAQGIATPIIGGFVNRFLPFGQYNGPVITLGTGWLLSKAFSLTSFTRRFSHAALVFGAAAAAMQVLQPIVARTIGGGAPAPTLNGWPNAYSGYGRRMRGIAAVTGVPPMIQPPPMPAPQGAQAMQGMGMRPGNWQ